MTIVRIRIYNSTAPIRKVRLLELLSENDIYANRIYEANEGFTIYTMTEGDLDKLFIGITDIYLLPPELKAKRSVIIFNVDPYIYNKDVDDMTSEIIDKNPFTAN